MSHAKLLAQRKRLLAAEASVQRLRLRLDLGALSKRAEPAALLQQAWHRVLEKTPGLGTPPSGHDVARLLGLATRVFSWWTLWRAWRKPAASAQET